MRPPSESRGTRPILVRTAIVWAAVGDYGLNPWLYLVLDLISASVDAVSTPRMVIRFVDDQYRKALQWAAVSLAAFVLPDVYHTLRPGHRLMVQVQSTWFPLVDRNPQTFCDIYKAEAGDFKKQTHRVYRDAGHPSRITVGVAR